MRSLFLLVSASVSLSACAPKELLKATADLGAATRTAAASVRQTSTIVVDLCRTEAELDFLTHLAKDQTPFKTWDEYYRGATLSDQATRQARGPVTWSTWCAGFAVVDRTFEKITLAIGSYGAALAQAAGSQELSSTDIAGLTKSVSDDLALFVPWAAQYKSTLEGIGSPLAKLTNGLLTLWVGQKVRIVVDGADRPVHEALEDIGRFLAVADKELAFYVDVYRVGLTAQGSNEPLAVAMEDMMVTKKVEAARARLATYATAIHKLETAHAALRRGWDADCCVSKLADAKEVSSMAMEVANTIAGTAVGGQ
jgi:hypothetical protein